ESNPKSESALIEYNGQAEIRWINTMNNKSDTLIIKVVDHVLFGL
ncbi:18696_t:CDS:2, partial [Dentiscutata erythropus]